MSENTGICPQLPAITVRNARLLVVCVEPSALMTVKLPRNFGANRFFTPPTKYASQLIFAFKSGSVSSIMAASKPMPAIIRNAWPWSSSG